jgi:PEP-CTERM motif
LKKTLLISLLGAITSLTVPMLSANIIIAGGSGSPDVFGAGTGTGLTLLASTNQTIQPVPGTSFNATYTEWVYSDTSGTVSASGGSAGLCQNCLDFFIEVSNAGPGVEEHITTASFAGFSTDVGYSSVGVTSGPAAQPAGIIPNLVDRSSDGSVVDFNYTTTNVTSGENTVLLEIQTNATSFIAGTVSVQDGTSGFNAGFAPTSAPEPGTMVLFGLGFIGLGMAKFRGNQKSA